MKILEEVEETVYNMKIDFEENEYDILLNYANTHMPEEELSRLKIEWALIESIKASIKTLS